jgi:hypothetical protein
MSFKRSCCHTKLEIQFEAPQSFNLIRTVEIIVAAKPMVVLLLSLCTSILCTSILCTSIIIPPVEPHIGVNLQSALCLLIGELIIHYTSTHCHAIIVKAI